MAVSTLIYDIYPRPNFLKLEIYLMHILPQVTFTVHSQRLPCVEEFELNVQQKLDLNASLVLPDSCPMRHYYLRAYSSLSNVEPTDMGLTKTVQATTDWRMA
ncbi:Uncharacterized protein Adt_04414 [Abeliophyllum distichum]|uniref:Uncharacterized protein n=1 Tax=Abeliophyllum distichum TaxID=126358 RepID=A0ABD1W1A5_9LAMI